MPATPATPSLPDRYTNLRRIARGGMAEVWHARDSRLDRDVAIKLVTTGDGIEDDATRLARFERESRVVARLSTHPNVVTIYDVGEAGDRPYLAMEWMDGGTLADRLVGPTPPATGELITILDRVASALDAAHADGIVHRDVKPGNILFDAHGATRIGDFGIATFAADPAATLTQAGAVVGTSGYIAPEQANGEGAIPASDQYALMVIAFEALTRARPYARDSIVAELAAHVGEPIPSASARAPHLPPAVDEVFYCALAKDPGARFADCTQAVAALRGALDDPGPTVAMPRSPAAAVAATAAAPARSRRRRALAGALAVLGILGVLAAGAFGDDPEPESTADSTTAPRTTPTPTPATTTEEPKDTRPVEPEATPEPVADPGPTAAERRDAAIALHERSFAALQAGDFQRAHDLGIAALADLGGVQPWEAYANYNVGAALVGLGRCDQAFAYLDRSEQLQDQRPEIDAAREAAAECATDGDDDRGNGNGKGAGNGGRKDKDDDGDD